MDDFSSIAIEPMRSMLPWECPFSQKRCDVGGFDSVAIMRVSACALAADRELYRHGSSFEAQKSRTAQRNVRAAMKH